MGGRSFPRTNFSNKRTKGSDSSRWFGGLCSCLWAGGIRPGRLYQSLRVDWISEQFSATHWVEEDGEIEPLWEVAGKTCYAKELAIDEAQQVLERSHIREVS